MKHYCCHLLNGNGKVQMPTDYKYTIIYRDTPVVISVATTGRVCLHFTYHISFLNITWTHFKLNQEKSICIYCICFWWLLNCNCTSSQFSFPFKCLFSFLAYRFVDYFNILRALNSNWRFFLKRWYGSEYDI